MNDTQDYIIELPNSGKIHGILRGSLEEQEPLIIFVHGLTDSPKNLVIYTGAKYLSQKGFTTFSIFLYDDSEEYRNLSSTSLDDNVNDLEVVVQHFRSLGFKFIYGVGHSYGGLAIIKSKAGFDKLVLWDPSHGLAYRKVNNYPEILLDNYIIGTQGQGYVYPKEVKEYNKKIGDNSKWAQNLSCPVKFICAENGVLIETSKMYSRYLKNNFEFCIIEGASHNFDDSDQVIGKLHLETYKWFK